MGVYRIRNQLYVYPFKTGSRVSIHVFFNYCIFKRLGEVNISDCYSATRRGVAKIYIELVALRLLYTVMPITKV